MTKQYYTAKEVAEAMGTSQGTAYKIIRELNEQLKKKGFITVSGKVNRAYFMEKCCYAGGQDGGLKVD